MNKQKKARELFEDVRKLHAPDRPTVTSELALSELHAQSARCSVAVGSAFSRTPLRVKKGKWVYRNFHVVTKGWHWTILSACGDAHPAKSLTDARKQIDAWYEEGSVE